MTRPKALLEGMKGHEVSEVNETIARWTIRRARPAHPVRRDDDR
ncbi:hypothetical protein ACFU76_23035 [Streptomyces sp. NPDC057539]